MNPAHSFPLIVHGLPYTTLIPRHLKESLASKNPYILISGSLARNTSTLVHLTAALHASNLFIAGVRQGMTPHTLYSEVLAVASDVRQSNADSILVVGGGSLVDAAKAIVFALANGADTMDALAELLETSNAIRTGKVKDVTQKPSVIPIMCATTTLSGGEFNPHGGATDDRTKLKQLFSDPKMEGHKVIVCDPALTLTAPMRVWLSTGLRAVDHCVETICSSAPKKEGTEAALRGLKRLIPNLLRTKADPKDERARLESQLGSMESMRPFVVYGVPVGGSHGIGHQIGPMGVPHAETTCVALPAVLKFNKRVSAERQNIVAEALWGEETARRVFEKYNLDKEKADLGDLLDAIIRELGFPRTLKTYGIGRDKLDAIAENALKDHLCQMNVIPLTEKEQVLEILEMCIGDDD